MNRTLAVMAVGAVITAGALVAPTLASAQESEFCNLVTPAVRDVVKDAPIVSIVLSLDAALPDSEVLAQRDALGCGPVPTQTPDQARTEVCDVLTVARLESLVASTNNPETTRLLDSINPETRDGLVASARNQLRCDTVPVVPAPSSSAATPVPAPAPAQVDDVPTGGVETGGR